MHKKYFASSLHFRRSQPLGVASCSGRMSDPNAVKVLIAGDVRGNLGALYKRVSAVNDSKAGPFHALFCVGPFFRNEDAAAETGGSDDELAPYVDGTAVAPIPTYFTDALPGGSRYCRDATTNEIAPNITFLRVAEVAEIAGLRVAALPGHYNQISYTDESQLSATAAREEGEYTVKDVAVVKQSHNTSGGGVVDILLTSDWPQGVCAFARDKECESTESKESPARAASNNGSPACADLARELQPRYHVAGTSGVFYAREPYRNSKGHVTRFIGLGSVGNVKKVKWLHALALTPATSMPPSALVQQPADTTASPYTLPVNLKTLPGPPGAGEKRPFGVDGEGDFDHASLRWEDAGAKKQRLNAHMESQKRPLKGDLAHTVYVRNLNFRADEGAVGQFFGQCGEIVDLKLGRDKDTGRSRGFCHVVFDGAESVAKALELTNQNFFGRDVVVDMAKSDEQRSLGRGNNRNNRKNLVPPTGCWFCLSNEKDTHLVASIASESFVSMDKGGLVPDHCQVVPVEHTPSFASMTPSTAEEVFSYINSIRKMLNDGGGMLIGSDTDTTETPTSAPRDLVVFERHLALRSKGGNHCHMNCVPIPKSVSKKARKIFEQAAKRLNFEWDVVDKKDAESALGLQTVLQEKAGDSEYYAVHLPDGQILFRLIQPKEPFWMSFGREVLGYLLGCPERTAWQQCMESETAETTRAEKFKNVFEPYDEPAKKALG